MAEIQIKRTNFFDGQFLKQGEFIDLDVYHQHLRRRWAFVLFNQSGVVQASATDLNVEVPNPAQKVLLVRAGMAIGKRPDLMEAKEIILRTDTAPIDLTVASANVPTPLVGGTGFVTVHYEEEPINVPVSEGDVPGMTRVLEHARITVHNAAPGPTAPNGEPYIRLGDVTFASMALSIAQRQTAFLNAALVAPTPQISLSLNTFPATGPVSVTVNSAGGLNLSGATAASVQFLPNTGISNVVVSAQTPTSMTLAFTLTNAPVGLRTVTVTTNLSASTTFNVQAVVPAPTITTLPATATRNQLMTIVGTNFLNPVSVTFAGPAVKNTFSGVGESLSPTQIVLIVPNAAVSGPITITAAGGMVTSGVLPVL